MGIPPQKLDNDQNTESSATDNGIQAEFPFSNHSQQETHFHEQTYLQRVVTALNHVTIEPAVFLITLGFMLQVVIGQSLVIRKFCLIYMNLTEDQCSHINTNETLETKVDKFASVFSVGKVFIDIVPAIIFALFVGAWSDKRGRKKAMILPAIGGMISMTMLIINAHWMTEISPIALLFCSLPLSSTGGLTGILIFTSSYITDIVPQEKLTFRMGLMQISFLLATPVGLILGGILFSSFGFITVFVTSFCLYFLSFLYILIRVKETIQPQNNGKNCCSNFFDLQNVKDGYHTLTKKRENNHRFHLALFMLISVINVFPFLGEVIIGFLYVRHKFHWQESIYSFYMATMLSAMTLGLMLGIPVLTRVFKVSDASLGLISSATKIASDIIVGLSTEGWMMFASCLFVIFNGVVSPVTRSIVSKCTTSDERGKIYSMIGAFEALAPVLGGPVYVGIFNSTLSTFPGAVYLVSASFYIIPMVLFRYLIYDMKKFEPSETEELSDKKQMTAYGSTISEVS